MPVNKIPDVLYVYVANCGDGSPWLHWFTTKEKAEAYARVDEERYCDDIFKVYTGTLSLRLDEVREDHRKVLI